MTTQIILLAIATAAYFAEVTMWLRGRVHKFDLERNSFTQQIPGVIAIAKRPP